MFRIGAHVSISDGFEKAVDREQDLGGTCGQLFVGSPRGWAVSDVEAEAAAEFSAATTEANIEPWVVHGTYLINLATPKPDLGTRSLETVQAELDAAASLEIPYYVFHPGAHTGAGEETGLANVADRLGQLDVPDGVTVLLENTAGSGTTVGRRIDHLDEIIRAAQLDDDALGVCLDTCHLYAAGYDFTTDEGLADLVETIEETVGVDRVHYLHLNDSKHPLGSEKDEHQHIGEGEIGVAGFSRVLNHEALRDKPMVLETPEDEKGYEWNIQQCRDLRTEP